MFIERNYGSNRKKVYAGQDKQKQQSGAYHLDTVQRALGIIDYDRPSITLPRAEYNKDIYLEDILVQSCIQVTR